METDGLKSRSLARKEDCDWKEIDRDWMMAVCSSSTVVLLLLLSMVCWVCRREGGVTGSPQSLKMGAHESRIQFE